MRWRWLIWLVYVLTWTWALLLPNPNDWACWLLGHPGDQMGDPPFRLQLLLFVESFFFSKGLHVSAYAVFAILSMWLRVPWRYRWLLVVFMSCHAMGTEFFQNFEPSRHPSWRDVGLDHLGIILGMGATWKGWLARSRDKAAASADS